MSRKKTLYRLDEAVSNPKPDRRFTGNWLHAEVFLPGLYLLVERPGQQRAIRRARCFSGDTYYGELLEHTDEAQFVHLLGFLKQVQPSSRDLSQICLMFDGEFPGGFEILSWLLAHGVVSSEQLDIAVKAIEKEQSGEEEPNV